VFSGDGLEKQVAKHKNEESAITTASN